MRSALVLVGLFVATAASAAECRQDRAIYTDRDVKAGTTYRYAVTALDRARRPNESPRSNVVSVRVE